MAKVDVSKWNKRLRAMEDTGVVAMEDIYEELVKEGFILNNTEEGSNKPISLSSKYKNDWMSNKTPEEQQSLFDKLDNLIPSSRGFKKGYYGMAAETQSWQDLFDDFWGDYYEGSNTPSGLKITNFDNKGFSDEDLFRLGDDIAEFAYRAGKKRLNKGDVLYYKKYLEQALTTGKYGKRLFPTTKKE